MQNNRIFQKIFAFILIFFIVGGMFFLFTSRQTVRTDNPLLERETDSSAMYQDEAVSLSINDPSFAPMEGTGNHNSDSDIPPQTDESSTEPQTEISTESQTDNSPSLQEPNTLFMPEEPDIADDNSQIDHPASSGEEPSTEVSGGTEDIPPSEDDQTTSDNPSDLLPPADIPEDNEGIGDTFSETNQVYFTTNILNGSTISTRELDVVITHKIPYLTPLSTTVELNGVPIQFNGHLLLEEGANSIRITVIYADQEGHQIEVSKTYTVYVELEKVIITTDLKDRTINQRSFSFTAYASASSQRIPVSVTVNGNSIDASGNHYQTTLQEGNNEIVLYAETAESWAEVRAYIFVDLPDQMQITTDLYDHEVDNPNFDFYAALSGGTENATLTVVANGITLSGDNCTYHTTLARGNNYIRLKASDVDGAEYTQEFILSYHNYVVQEAYDADETMPRIYTNVSDGMALSGTIYSLQVRGEDGTGQRIYGDHLNVELNGVTLEDRSEDGNTTYYQLELLSGINTLTITVWDYEDRYTIYRYSINCNSVPEGERIGSITVSVEATTVGLGYLVPPTTIDIYQGQNLVVPVATVLESYGYQYRYSGSLENGFYLMHIIKDGITNGYHIPEDLEDAINEDGLMWTNEYYTSSLGEFDFTQGSGWMYSVNGLPSLGMSDVYPADGDVICLRYTLAYGRDVGMGISSDGSSHNYSREW